MSSPRPSELTDHLGFWLRYVSNSASQAFARRVEAHGVTVAEWVVLRHLFEQAELPPNRLAQRMGMTKGAISKLADRLIAKSLARRSADLNDRRAQILSLTHAGRALIPTLAALADENDAEFFGHLEPADRAALLRILRGIVERRGLKLQPTE